MKKHINLLLVFFALFSITSCNTHQEEPLPTESPSTNNYIDNFSYPNSKIPLGNFGDFLTSTSGDLNEKELISIYNELSENIVGKKNDIFQTNYQKGLLDFFDINNKVKITLLTEIKDIKKINQYHEQGNEESYRVCDLDIYINDLMFHYEDVGFRLKGNTSRGIVLNSNSSLNQRHYKLCFNEMFDDDFRDDNYTFKDEKEKEYRENRTFFGLEKLDIRWNKNKESTNIREYYAFEMYRQNNNLAPRSTPFNFEMNIGGNAQNAGVYLAVEPIDKDFIKRNVVDGYQGGDLYKLGWANYDCARFDSTNSRLFGVEKQSKNNGYFTTAKYVYDLKTNKKSSKHEDIKTFINKILSTSKEDFDSMLNEYTYYNSFINYLAISYLLGDPDDLRGNYNNTYVYFIPYENQASKAYFIPTDHDRVLGQTGDPSGNPTGHHSTLSNPFDNNTGYGGENTMPLFNKSIFENGNDIVKSDYIKSIDLLIENNWFDIEKFIDYYNKAYNNYKDCTKLGNRFTNDDVAFSLKESNDIYSTDNLSIDIFFATKVTNYLKYKESLSTLS